MSAMFDLDLLRTFLAVVETRHFTAAGRTLGLSQSTISQHIRRLELAAGRKLLARDTHTVTLTAEGGLMARFAKDIVEANQRACDYFSDRITRDRVRFGVSEDMVMTGLPQILSDFLSANPMLSIELSVGLTDSLYNKLDSGRLDLVFAKRRPADDRGTVIWRERLTWLSSRNFQLRPDMPAPLVLYQSSSITGTLAVEALNRAGRPWYLACSSETLSGLRAATLAGSGITAQSRLLLRHGDLVEPPEECSLPPLGEVEFVVLGRSARLQGATAALAEVVTNRGPELWAATAA
jgi:DNA-binding transcriptional LysR family regulator